MATVGRWRLGCAVVALFVLSAGACGGSSGDESASGNGGGGTGGSGGESVVPDEPAPGVTSDCGSVRLSEYGAEPLEWCGFDRTHAVLPEFVRQGLTVAIAEPYNGSSYQGEPGEACGECWEVDTLVATQIVMVHDLCPIEGNALCAGGHFHFDVSLETAAVLGGGGWLGEAALRRIPCPVTGNIHARISDRNQYGYLKLAFFNHRIPIRTAEYRAVGGNEWLPLQRCLARWCVEDDLDTFADDGPGGVLRLTSATGETVEGTTVISYDLVDETVFDTGTQFTAAEPSGELCEFGPPGNVYDEEWGGIPGVRWEGNTWGSTTASETGEGCADSSASCLLLSAFDAGSGINVTYRSSFPTATFSRLILQLRALSGTGEVEITPRSEDSRCTVPTTVAVGAEWSLAEIDVTTSCADRASIQGFTIRAPSETLDLLVDEIRFE